MPDLHRLSLANLPHRLRERLADWPEHWRTWWAELRADPAMLWRGPLPRLVGLVVLGVALILGINWAIHGLAAATVGVGPEKTTASATLYVACANPACRAQYTTQQPLDFKAWPLKCEKCDGPTVYRAVLCPTCRHWYATAPGNPPACPFCAEKKAGQNATQPQHDPKKKSGDDAEDSW